MKGACDGKRLQTRKIKRRNSKNNKRNAPERG